MNRLVRVETVRDPRRELLVLLVLGTMRWVAFVVMRRMMVLVASFMVVVA